LTAPTRTGPIRAKISALGTYLPPRVLTNADLEKMVDTTNDWIMERVGIRERHLVDKGVAASDLAVEAVKKLVASHPFDLQEVDLIVVGTVTPDMMYPSTACLVQHKLGIVNTWGFDVSAGCSGFLYALNTGVEVCRVGTVQEGAGDRVGREFVDDRLHRSRRVHHFWRRGGRGFARTFGRMTNWASSITWRRLREWEGSIYTCRAGAA
jgi:hypothetical protein